MRFTTSAIAKSAIAALATAAVAFAGAPASAATTADPETAQIRCGYYRNSNGNWYGHCDELPRTDVIIRVESYTGHYDMCVKPGTTKLDAFAYGAYYAGRLCWAG
ncbi:DUF6355 family natural product biosynthesis protein [Nonomuraea sp. NPDC050404]|uniref:DUF6355 family natural product biosynthesis protein n=1 Tax=Nonomuraea sp. NPDC050404 TaxID=3155783 RepID=UPI003411A071